MSNVIHHIRRCISDHRSEKNDCIAFVEQNPPAQDQLARFFTRCEHEQDYANLREVEGSHNKAREAMVIGMIKWCMATAGQREALNNLDWYKTLDRSEQDAVAATLEFSYVLNAPLLDADNRPDEDEIRKQNVWSQLYWDLSAQR